MTCSRPRPFIQAIDDLRDLIAYFFTVFGPRCPSFSPRPDGLRRRCFGLYHRSSSLLGSFAPTHKRTLAAAGHAFNWKITAKFHSSLGAAQ